MPQSQPKPRWDPSGRPIQPLTDARVEPLKDRPANQSKRELIQQLLTEIWEQVLRRGWYGNVTVSFQVQDGMIEQIVDTQIAHHRE